VGIEFTGPATFCRESVGVCENKKTPPYWWGKSICKNHTKNRAAKLSPTEVFLFLFFDNADMNGTTIETEKMKNDFARN
jgi:hypothetical protein